MQILEPAWPDSDWILLAIGQQMGGVMADDLTPDTLRTCEAMQASGLLAHTETVGTIRVYHTTEMGRAIFGGVSQ